jgi:hypothetical protein
LSFSRKKQTRVLSFKIEGLYLVLFAQFGEQVCIELGNSTSVWVKA